MLFGNLLRAGYRGMNRAAAATCAGAGWGRGSLYQLIYFENVADVAKLSPCKPQSRLNAPAVDPADPFTGLIRALAGSHAAAVFLAGPEMKPAMEAYYRAGGRGLVYGSAPEVWLAEARRLIIRRNP